MRLFLFFCLIFLVGKVGNAQERNYSSNDSLSFWSDVMFNAKLGISRSIASKQVENLLPRLLESNSLDTNKLNPNLVRLKIPEYSSELYSWQVELEQEQFEYYAFLKLGNGKIIQFKREQRNYQRIRKEEFSSDNWYGAIYYHIIPKTYGKQKYYILFGFAQNENKEKFKIIESFKIVDNKPVFGFPIFKLNDEDGEIIECNRQVIRYSQSVSCTLNYEEADDMIVYDHIINYQDPNAPQIQNFFPDGSYEALQYLDDHWNYIPKLKVEAQKDAPRDNPILDNKSKDIFGRDKKKKFK